MKYINPAQLVETIQALKPTGPKPTFVAISGFGGSGKSTLAGVISSEFEGSVVVPIDDFIIGARDERSEDWRTFDRNRLKTEVLEKAIVGEQLRYQRYNSGEWVKGNGGSGRELQIGRLVIIEGCSVIHPDLVPFYSTSVWIDCTQEHALASAKSRDILEADLFGDDNTSKLWDEVWGPNDADFFKTIRPDMLADVIIEPQF